ncbi:hypothetical protein [Pseudoalteromonas xiamenensis]
MDIGSIAGIIIGLIGLVVGAWQNRQRVSFEQLVRANNWFNLQQASNSNGTLQLALDLYKQKHSNELSTEVLEQLSRADAFGQCVTKESVRQIYLFEPSFTKDDISAWEAEGKISEALKKVFLQLAEKEKK